MYPLFLVNKNIQRSKVDQFTYKWLFLTGSFSEQKKKKKKYTTQPVQFN